MGSYLVMPFAAVLQSQKSRALKLDHCMVRYFHTRIEVLCRIIGTTRVSQCSVQMFLLLAACVTTISY